MGKLKSRSYQWTSPHSAVAFTAFADAWPGAIEKEIGAALCAIGAGKDFDILRHSTQQLAFKGSMTYDVLNTSMMYYKC